VVAEQIIAKIRGSRGPEPYGGLASCYVEFGDKLVGRVDVDFSGPQPVGPFTGPSLETAEEKGEFATSRRKRWFGYEE
jgi:sulfide:quinone oxidoreductase